MKNKRNPMYLAIQSVLATGALLSAGVVFAQDEDEDKVELERVVTTGTHIRSTDLENAAPVFSIDREDIQRTGLTDVGDLLRQIPAAGASLNLSNNNGGDGSIRVDLRNLGSNRVLVLVNGRRWVRTLGGAADLTTIPISVIERIDVLKDGASAIYGSDAISGVINVITRSDYEGVEASAYYGKTGEDDGARQTFNVAMGTASDRGSVFFNVEYTKIEEIMAGDRDFSKLPVFGTGNTLGSSGTPQGRFLIFTPPGGQNLNDGCGDAFGIGLSNCTTTPGSNGIQGPGDPDLIPFSDDTRFNYAPDNYLITPQERTSVYVQGKYQLTDNVSVSSEVLFNRRESVRLLAPQPLFFGFAFGSRPGVDIIDIGGQNPYNPYGVDIPGTYTYLIGRRMIEAGNRIFSDRVDTFHYGIGFEGFIDAGTGWDWSVNYSLGRTDVARRGDGELNMTRVQRSLSNACVTDSSCVPLNLFGGEGSITQAMADYITFEAHSFGTQKLIQYSGVVSSEIAELPAGPLGFAAGYEHRRSSGGFRPDYIITSGQTSGNQSDPTNGAFTVDEFFAEFNVPLLSGVAGAEVLEFSAAARYSDYDGFGGSSTGKVGLRWKPIDDLLIRATYSEGFRAPNISELFGGSGDSFPNLTDPCNGGEAANPGLPGCVGIPSTYQQANSQIRITVGSNSSLQPEESTSYTLGAVYEPSFAEGLVVTLDYYDIDIDNVVTSLGAFTILNSCANTGTLFCNLMSRSSSGSVTDVLSSGINSAKLQVKGIDMTASYKFDTDYGLFGLVWDTSYTDEYVFSNTDFTTGGLVPNDGFAIEDSGIALPRVKSNLTADWSYGDWSVNYQMRYTAGHDEVCDPDLNDSSPSGLFRPDGDPTVPSNFQWCTQSAPSTTDGTLDARHVGGYTVHDANVSYHLADYDMSFSLGIENLFDREPPLSANAFANSYEGGLYDGSGRYYWFRVNKRF
jgi:outer membrane receptor protein involved in Fe transport